MNETLTKRTWLAAACRGSAILGQHYVSIPVFNDQCEDVAAVKVTIVYSKTQWSQGRLFRRQATEPVSMVALDTRRALLRKSHKEFIS